MATHPTTVTIYGRLSFPVFTHAEAVTRNATSPYPIADASKVAPGFNLLLEQPQLDKFVNFVTNDFLPYCAQQHAAGEKKDALDPRDVTRILKIFPNDLGSQPPYVPLKEVSEKSLELMPSALASLKVSGRQGQDLTQMAIVNDESELLVPDPDLITFPVIKPISQTVHDLYAGCYAAATLNLYAYKSGALPGFSASAGTLVFKAGADRFGGGIEIDEAAMFLD